jgi:putative FmdB family regulatory protein
VYLENDRMPLFDYICKDCRKRFEALVSGSRQAQCPLCRSTNLEQQLSSFAVGNASSGSRAMGACAAAAGGG